MANAEVREQVRARYAAAAATAMSAAGREALAVVDADQCCVPSTAAEANASCCGGGGAVDAAFGSTLYSAGEQGELPAEAVAASLGCGNPLAVAELRAGERVLDLGLGGGIDVPCTAATGERCARAPSWFLAPAGGVSGLIADESVARRVPGLPQVGETVGQ